MPEPIRGEYASTPRPESSPVRNLVVKSETGSDVTYAESAEPTVAPGESSEMPKVEREVGPEGVQGVDILITQVDRLLARTKVLREKTGLPYKEAQKASNLPGFAASRSNLQKLRQELAALKESQAVVSKEDLQKLRLRVANHLRTLKGSVKNREEALTNATNEPASTPSAESAEQSDAATAVETADDTAGEEKKLENENAQPVDEQNETLSQHEGSSATEATESLDEDQSVPVEEEGSLEKQAELKGEFESTKRRLDALLQTYPELDGSLEHKLINESTAQFEQIINDSENLNNKTDQAKIDLDLMKRQLENMIKKVTGNTESVDSPAKEESKTDSDSTPILETVADQTTESMGSAPVEKKAYQERAELKANYYAAQSAYGQAYEKYLAERDEKAKNEAPFKKLAFWRKEHLPEELRVAEETLHNATFKYVDELMGAMGKRFLVGYDGQAWNEDNPEWGNKTQERREKNRIGLKAALANRFVIQAAHEKLKIERAHVPEGAAGRTLESMQKFFKKNGRVIKWAGIATVVGAATISGGITAGVLAAGGRKISTQIAGGAAIAGAVVGGMLGQRVVRGKGRERDTSADTARASFNANKINLLKEDYEGKIRGFEKAKRNQKYYTVGGAILGGVAGAAVAGQLDLDSAVSAAADVPTDGLVEGAAGLQDASDVMPDVPDVGVQADNFEVPEAEAPDTSVQEAPEVQSGPDAAGAAGVAAEAPDTSLAEADGPEASESTDTAYAADEQQSEGTEAFDDIPEMPYTFVYGGVNNVSEALFDSWKENPEMLGLDDSISKTEFLRQMWTIIADLEKDPVAYGELLDRMGIDSGSIHAVQAGQTINLEPFYELIKAKY